MVLWKWVSKLTSNLYMILCLFLPVFISNSSLMSGSNSSSISKVYKIFYYIFSCPLYKHNIHTVYINHLMRCFYVCKITCSSIHQCDTGENLRKKIGQYSHGWLPHWTRCRPLTLRLLFLFSKPTLEERGETIDS